MCSPLRRKVVFDKTQFQWLDLSCERELVSVVIPLYNRVDLICETMDSVFTQTYRPIELIVVDDGSSDNSPKIVENWAKKAERDENFFFQLVQQKNNGASTARNRGLLLSKGEYIQFLDSDDLLAKNKLRLQVSVLEKTPEARWVSGGTSYFNETGKYYLALPEKIASVQELLEKYICYANWFMPHTPLYRRLACAKVGKWDEKLPCLQDWEYGVRVIVRLGIPAYCNEVVAFYRNEHSKDQITVKSVKEARYFVSKYDTCRLVWDNIPPKMKTKKVKSQMASRVMNFARMQGQLDHAVKNKMFAWALELAKGSRLSCKIAVVRLMSATLGSRVANRCYDFFHMIRNKRLHRQNYDNGRKSKNEIESCASSS